jgi:acyl carrier protein
VSDETNTRIRQVLAAHARLPVDVNSISDDEDLFAAGMSSHASVSVMLGLEDAFDVEFPDEMLTRSVFARISAIRGALHSLQADLAA